MTDQDKQRRLFNRISNRLESETNARDETTFDESNAQVRLNPGLRYIAELLKTRQRYALKSAQNVNNKISK